MALFQLINPPGQNQEDIGANDEQWDRILYLIVYISTNFTFIRTFKEFNYFDTKDLKN